MFQKNFTLKACRLPSDDIASKNAIFVNFAKLSELKSKTGAKEKLYVKTKGKIMEILGADGIEPDGVAMSKLTRKLLQIGEDDSLNFEYVFDKQPNKSNLTHIKFKVNPRKKLEEKITVEDTELLDIIKKLYIGSPFNDSTLLYFLNKGMGITIEACELEIDPLGPLNEERNPKNAVNFGFLAMDTVIDLASENSHFKIHSKTMKTKALTKFGFNFNEMGVGGLDGEISTIFRRAFTTRLYPTAYLEKYGIHHVKGILLYGPPGTGKTLIARTFANALNDPYC